MQKEAPTNSDVPIWQKKLRKSLNSKYKGEKKLKENDLKQEAKSLVEMCRGKTRNTLFSEVENYNFFFARIYIS